MGVQHSALTEPYLHAPKAHDLDSHNACTLAELNAIISDATLFPLSAGSGNPLTGNLYMGGKNILQIIELAGAAGSPLNVDFLDDGTLQLSAYNTNTGLNYEAPHAHRFQTKSGATQQNTFQIKYDEVKLLFGSFVPSGNNTLSVGTSGVKFADVWCTTLHQGDCAYAEQACAKCGKDFEVGDNIIHRVINIDDDTVTIPIHLECAALPTTKINLLRAVKEEYVELDEYTGELVTKMHNKTQEKTVTKHKMKDGYVLDNKSGKAFKIDEDGKRGKTNYNLSDVLETVEETVSEVVYEDVEFLL